MDDIITFLVQLHEMLHNMSIGAAEKGELGITHFRYFLKEIRIEEKKEIIKYYY
jgi:hypothetical protein